MEKLSSWVSSSCKFAMRQASKELGDAVYAVVKASLSKSLTKTAGRIEAPSVATQASDVDATAIVNNILADPAVQARVKPLATMMTNPNEAKIPAKAVELAIRNAVLAAFADMRKKPNPAVVEDLVRTVRLGLMQKSPEFRKLWPGDAAIFASKKP